MTLGRLFPSDHCSLCLLKYYFYDIHFAELVIFKPKTRHNMTRGMQKSSRVREPKCFMQEKVALPAKVGQLAPTPRVVSPPRDKLVILM